MANNSFPDYNITFAGSIVQTPSPPTSSSQAASAPTDTTPSPPAAQIPSSSQSVSVPPDSTPTASRAKLKQKKVRFACERCRYRRVKCDGQVPACGNCSKAGALCIDVDSRNTDRRLMRGTQEQAIARIAWLEDIIRTHLPHINIDDDPLTFGQAENFRVLPANIVGALEMPSQNTSMNMGNVQQNMGSLSGPTTEGNQSDPPRGTKRTLEATRVDSTLQEKSIDQDARSVALELGLLSLNSDSRQMHYLGSSSGTLFAPLFLAKKSGTSPVPESLAYSPNGSSGKERHSIKRVTPITSISPENQKNIEALYEQLRKILPVREECNILLERFFDHMHPNHPFLHRPSFNSAVNALYQCINGPAPTPFQPNSWPAGAQPFSYNGEEHILGGQKQFPISVHIGAFKLLMALSIGATLQIRGRRYSHNPKIFFNAAISMSSRVFGSISLPVLQSVLLVVVHSLIDPDGCDVWTLTHVAMAHSVDLGLHRESSNSGLFSASAIDIRRRVFFCVYSLDRSLCTIMGRPLGLGDDTFDLHLPQMSESQLQLVSSHVSSDEFDDIATLSYSIQTFKMAQLVSRIKSELYRLPGKVGFSKNYADTQNELRVELDRWLAESTSIVSTTVPENQSLRLTTKLQIHYHGAMSLLHQPSQAITHPSEDALRICFSSSTKRLHLYEVLYNSSALCHSWRTVQDMFLAGATIMYCVSISPAVRSSVSIISLSKDFRACSSMLSVGGEWWPTIRKAKNSLERLSNYILEMLAVNSESDGDHRVRQQPFPHDYTPNMATWNAPGIVGPNEVQQTLLNVVNHDGTLIDFFDDSLTNVLIDGMHQSEPNGIFDAAFWGEYDQSAHLDQGAYQYGEWN